MLEKLCEPQNKASTVKEIMKVWMKKFADCQKLCFYPARHARSIQKHGQCNLYESVFEKPDMWRIDGVPFSESSGLGKDVYGIVQRYLKEELERVSTST
ncbi:hypothetical protein TNCV_2603141 [Trichonephila clavipes]|nr:hypothetical protein TNCV_2603141 [Trichonephila clavipes]